MKNRNRPTPSFPAASSIIEAAPEPQDAVFHPGTEVLAAEAAHHEAVDASQSPQTPESVAETPAGEPEQPYSLMGGRYESGAPSVVGLGDGTITAKGEFQPVKDEGYVVDMAALEEEEAELDARIDAELKKIAGDGIVTLPDGSVKIPVIIDADKITILREWADGAGESFGDYLTKMVDMGLEAIVNGGAVAG